MHEKKLQTVIVTYCLSGYLDLMKFINITFVLFTTASFIVQSKKYPVKVGEKEGIGTVKIISKLFIIMRFAHIDKDNAVIEKYNAENDKDNAKIDEVNTDRDKAEVSAQDIRLQEKGMKEIFGENWKLSDVKKAFDESGDFQDGDLVVSDLFVNIAGTKNFRPMGKIKVRWIIFSFQKGLLHNLLWTVVKYD